MKKIAIAVMVFLGMIALSFFWTGCSDTPTCPQGQSCQAPCPEQKECPKLSLSDFSFEVKEEAKEYSEEELYIEKTIPLAVPSRSAEEVVNQLFEKLSPGFKETEDLSWSDLFDNYSGDNEAEMKSLYKNFYAIVIANDPKLPKLIAEKLKGMPGGKALLSLWGHFFINKYQDMDWNAKVVFSKGEKVQKLFARKGSEAEQEIKKISTEVIYSEPLNPRRDIETMFFITVGTPKPYLREGEKPGVVLTPTFGFADQKLEEMSNMDKLIWRLGPLFYKNLSGIILATEKLL